LRISRGTPEARSCLCVCQASFLMSFAMGGGPPAGSLQDLLSKLGIFITIPILDTVSIFSMQMASRPSLSLTPNLPLDQPALDPQVGGSDHPSIAKHYPPVHITLKDSSTIITQPQYSLTPEAHKGLKPIIDYLFQASILIPTDSPHNTPILAVKKRPNSWRLVQDLQKVDEAITPTFPVVPNPHTLLSTVPSTATHFMVLDLKDSFFTIPLHSLSQPLFACT